MDILSLSIRFLKNVQSLVLMYGVLWFMYPCVFLLVYHHLKLASGHTCKISYCTAILCVLASMLNLS